MIPEDALREQSDSLVRSAKHNLPTAELYEIGALFLSIGSFLVASAIPGTREQMKEIAITADTLLNQKEMVTKWQSLDNNR